MGTRKLWISLKKKTGVGRDRLFEILRARNALISPKAGFPKQRGYAPSGRYINHLKTLKVNKVHEAWVSDLTYLRLGGRFCFLTLVADAFSRRIIGYSLTDKAETKGVLDSLSQAMRFKKKTEPCILHFDQGTQYNSDRLARFMRMNGLEGSMSRKGKPTDNGRMERIIGILKQEFDLKRTFTSRKYLEEKVANAIYHYNHTRLHTALHYLTPAQVAPSTFF